MDVKITILQVDVANLRPNTWNTNSVGAQNFEKLKGSIEKLGFFKPILARELEDGFFEILGGEHRWRAAIEQGISTVPVLSVGKISDVVAKQMSLVDNERYTRCITTDIGAHTHSVAIGSHGHTITVNAAGNAENTVKNIAFNYIVRLA